MCVCLSVCVCFPCKRFLRHYWSHHHQTWHGNCLRHDNASHVNHINLDLHSKSQILIMNKCLIISETKRREKHSACDCRLLSMHWVASLCLLVCLCVCSAGPLTGVCPSVCDRVLVWLNTVVILFCVFFLFYFSLSFCLVVVQLWARLFFLRDWLPSIDAIFQVTTEPCLWPNSLHRS